MSYSAELAHYGVKGMKWGVRRAEKNSPNANYSKTDREKDKEIWGRGGVKRINQRMNKGKTREQAQNKERVRAGVQLALATGAYATIVALNRHGDTLASHIHDRANTKRGESSVRNTMARDRGLPSGMLASKQKRNGVYNITTM